MLNMVSLMPHSKKDNKVEAKESKGATLNELVELRGCSSCMFFEVSLDSLLLVLCYASICWKSLLFDLVYLIDTLIVHLYS